MIQKWILIVSSVIITCLMVVILALAGAAAIYKKTSQVSTPVVDIYSPQMDTKLLTGQVFVLQAAARDPDGVARIEFWLDERLIKQENSPLEKDITPLPLAHAARISQPGIHWLVVRAVDALGNSGQSSLRLHVTQAPEQTVSGLYVVKEGDTLAGIAEALGVPVEEITSKNPGMEDELPPAGEEIILPLPEPETEGDGVPAEGAGSPPEWDVPPVDGKLPLLDTPDITWDADRGYPRWLYPFTALRRPLSVPVGLLDFALLEVNADYDGVFCYVSAGDSPVIRVPSTGFLSRLSGNFWNIARWFSGDRMLPFTASTGLLRLRMNCMGYNSTTAGGIVHDLGTLDITRAVTDAGSELIDERASRGSGWFQVQFRVKPLRSSVETGYGYLTLESSRYGRDETSLVPEPHSVLEFRIFDEGRRINRRVMDGFHIYRNGSLWRTTGPNTKHYVVWDHLQEAGGCGEQTEFFVVGYKGNPLSPSATLESPRILIEGYCPPDEQFNRVTVQFNWFTAHCLNGMDSWYDTEIQGLSYCGGPGEQECVREEILSNPGCPYALDNTTIQQYGGLNVNGQRAFNLYGLFNSSPRSVDLTQWVPHTLVLNPGESLTISTALWDWDEVDDDPICPRSLVYSPGDLARIAAMGGSEYELVEMRNAVSHCSTEFKLTVEPFYAAPETIVP